MSSPACAARSRTARCAPDDIECVNAHATSTPVGDAGELIGLAQLFGPRLRHLPVVANKSQLGHSLGASAILECMAAVEGMTRGVLLPTLNHIPDPALPEAFYSNRGERVQSRDDVAQLVRVRRHQRIARRSGSRPLLPIEDDHDRKEH